MKKQLSAFLGIASLLLVSLASNAATVIWEPTDVVDPINSSLITFDFGLGITDVGIFDDSDTSLTAALLQFDAGFAEVLFTPDGNDWLLSSAQDTLLLADARLTDSSSFIIAVSDDSGTSWTSNLTAVQDPISADLYYLIFTDITEGNNLVILTDVTPVPLPAAVWMFSSALLGIITVARRRA